MNRKLFSVRLMVTGAILLITLAGQAQFVTIARKIKSMRTTQTDVATVLIDKETYKVYHAVIDTLSTSPKIKITGRDNARRLVEFTTGQFSVSMQVDSLAAGLSQITVSANHSDNAPKQPADIAVEAISRVCQKAGVKCTVEK